MEAGGPTIRVLGPVEAEIDGAAVDLGGRQQRAVLARLLVARGEVVSVDRLIDDLWHGEPPPKATGALQAYVSNLRRALEPERAPRTPARILVSTPPGYAIRLDADAVDAWEFERSLAALDDINHDSRVLELRGTLSKWRGDAFAEFAAESWASSESARLGQLRTIAREELVDALLRTARAAAAVLEAEQLVHDAPLRDEGWRVLALSQYAAGRQADALATLRDARRLLADELGVDPGPQLAELESAILAHNVKLPSTPAEPVAAVARVAIEVRPRGFVGRAGELQQLMKSATATQSNVATVALLAGEPGEGKSALLQELSHELGVAGWRVAVGRCPELAGAQPAWAIAEALRSLARDVDPGPLAGPLAPLLSNVALTPTGDQLEAQFRMHRAVSEWLGGMSDHPVALLLDDIHRADTQTRLVISQILEHHGPARVFLVLAYRFEPGGVLDDLLAQVATFGPLRVELGGLDDAAAGALLDMTADCEVDDDAKRILIERTGGNPFYLAETARLLSSEGPVAALSRVPAGVAAVIRRRLARLPGPTVAVLRVASVIGRSADLSVLTSAAQAPESDVIDAVEAGLISGLLVEDDDPRRVRFAHILGCDALYTDIPGPRRVALHAMVAGALARLYPGDIDALAYHAAEGATPATAALAAGYCVEAAGHATNRFSHDIAAHLYDRALRCLEMANAPADDRIRVLTDLVPTLINAGNAVAALEARERLVSLTTMTTDQHLISAALASTNVPSAWSAMRPYAPPDAAFVHAVERCLQSARLEGRERCLALNSLARELAQSGDTRLEAAAEEAVRLARKLDDPELIAMSLVTLSEVRLPEFWPDERDSIRSELRRIAEANDLILYEVLATIFDAASAIVRVDLAEARRAIDDAAAIASKYRLVYAQLVIGIYEAALTHMIGDVELAEQTYRDAFEHFRVTGGFASDLGLAAAGCTIAITTHRLGDLAPMLLNLDLSGGLNLSAGLAYALVESGDTDAARALCPVMLDMPHGMFWSLMISSAGMALAELGDRELGQRAYDELLPHSDQLAGGSSGYVFGPVARVLGNLAAMLGRPDNARQHFHQAAEIAVRCGNTYWIGQVEADLAALDG